MSDFNQQEWKNKKLDSFRINMKAQLSKELNIENPDDFIDALSGEYNATMDEMLNHYNEISQEIKTETQANEALKKWKKKIGGYADGMLVEIDIIEETLKLRQSPIDISGSSIDDGNKELTDRIDDRWVAYLVKQTFGEAIDLLFLWGKLGKFLGFVDIGFADLTSLNHTIIVDYINKQDIVKERKYILYNPTNNFDTALGSEWGNISSDMQTLDRVIFTRYGTPVELIYHKYYKKDTNIPNTFEFRAGSSDDKIISVLKRISYVHESEGNVVHLAKETNGEARKLITNYYANNGSNASNIMSHLQINDNADKKLIAIKQAAAYCLDQLKGYALENHDKASEYVNIDLYSNSHLKDRQDFFILKVKEKTYGNYNTYLNKYYDTRFDNDDRNLTPSGTNRKNIQTATKIVFIDKEYTPSFNPKDTFFKAYGYSGNDNINLENSKKAYVESGLGSDSITTGSGDDIIYTNVNTEDGGVDNEDENTINTVNSGTGNDTIHGSKAKDIITTKEGTNYIYTKDSDDKVTITDAKENHIYLGAGSDEANISDGTNYIYTGIDNLNKQDKDTESDINTINITSGKNYVYGSKAVDMITLNEGTSHIYTLDGDDFISSSNANLNKIYAGAGSDTLEINSGSNYIYTHLNFESDTIDRDTKDNINTINITSGKNYVYGGKGIENITVVGNKTTEVGLNLNDGDNQVEIAGSIEFKYYKSA